MLKRIRNATPVFFEQLIVALLLTMDGIWRIICRSGDGGVDGVIDQDELGLDRVYIQAKRYAANNTVSTDQIHDFFGSLDGHKAARGVFVTTSSFTKEAHKTAEKMSKRIILIDGEKLARLMIRHNVGCHIENKFSYSKNRRKLFK